MCKACRYGYKGCTPNPSKEARTRTIYFFNNRIKEREFVVVMRNEESWHKIKREAWMILSVFLQKDVIELKKYFVLEKQRTGYWP